MSTILDQINQSFQKPKVVGVKSGDNVRVHQKIREGNKERIQVFNGLVIKTSKQGGHLNRITVRRIASGVGVEKSFLLHSPLVTKVEITKRSKVGRNYLSYMRSRTGKSARLSGIEFNKEAVNMDNNQTNLATKDAESDKQPLEKSD
jgi:large subunit ribosomal protein L19